MKKFLFFLILVLALLIGGYLWLMSEGEAENADQTSVTQSLPLVVEE